MTYRNYEFTAFTEADLLGPGDNNLGCGDSFTMPASATTCITVSDNDAFLSGDSCKNENADDHYGQKASIEGENGELGNGGQIYAESYYWVKDQHGNKYVMIEIEQEGTSGDYFTFHSGYGMPPAGAQLTIVSQGNVTSNWVDYKCLDAGEKVELGSISGSVFCDVDCDGINGTQTVVAGHDYTIEAEDMHKWNMKTFHGDNASGGAGVKLACAGEKGAISTDFAGKSGTYDVKIRVQDENDGKSVIKLKVNGVFIEAVRLDNDNNGGGSNNGHFSTFVIRDVAINKGDQIKLVADGDGHEFVRIDKLVFEGEDRVVNTPEPAKEGVLVTLLDAHGDPVLGNDGQPVTTTTDADGNYHFNDVPAGDYRVKFTNPDGTAFTLQDEGDNDAIDSDVNADGVSGVISVAGGEDVKNVDAGLKVVFKECDDPDAVKIDFEGFAAGTVIDTEYPGVTIEAQRAKNNTAENDAMIFDSANPTGGDTDLATATQGNILIVSEDNDSSDPDDAIGGTITFAFDNPANIFDIKVVDAEEGGTINLLDSDGNQIGSVAIPNGIDGGLQQVMIETDGVSRMEIVLNGSGAVDDLCYVPGEPATGSISGTVFCDTDCDGLSEEPGPGGDLFPEWPQDISNIVIYYDRDGDGEIDFSVKLDDFPDGNASSFIGNDLDAYFGQVNAYVTGAVAGLDASAAVIGVSIKGGTQTTRFYAVSGDANGDAPDDGPTLNTGPGNDAELSYGGFYATYDPTQGGGTGGTVTEPVKAGVVVKLLDADGAVVAMTETGEDGTYSFTDIPVGDYRIMGIAPDGTEFTIKDVGDDDAIDSDVDETGTSDVIAVTAGSVTDVDLGVCEIEAGSLSGRYFIDANRNDQDDNEPGVGGVVVELLDADGNVIASTTTAAADGAYSFGDLAPGTYAVKFTDDVSGRTLVDPNVGDDATDSDAIDLGGGMSIIEGIVVNAGENTPDNDAGVEDIPGSLSGTYFCDVNENDINDAGDIAEAGRAVKLLDADGNPALDIDGNAVPQTETDTNGNYRFTNLAAGSYIVMFGIPDAAEGKEFVTPDVGDDTVDSDVLGQTGMTAVVEVVAGQETENVDAGIADINDAPVAVDDAGMVCVGESTPINLLEGDSDPDGDALSVTSIADADENVGVGGTITLASGATVTLNADGTVSVDASAAAPDLLIGDSIVDEFVYHVSDGALTSEGGVDLTLKGALNTVETIDESLGDVGVVTASFDRDLAVDGDLYEITVESVEFPDTPLGEALTNIGNFELAFCLSVTTPISLAPTTYGFDVAVLDADSYNAAIAGAIPFNDPDFGINPENIDNVNWLLNEAGTLLANGYTEANIQRAIWNLVDGGDDSLLDGSAANNFFNVRPEFGGFAAAQELSELALANDGFVAESGDLVGVIFDPVEDGVQPLVAAVEFDLLSEDCIC